MTTNQPTQVDHIHPKHFVFNLEVEAYPYCNDVPYLKSGAEILVDALAEYKMGLISELDSIRQAWLTSNQLSGKDIEGSLSTGNFARCTEEIKVCDAYLEIIAGKLSANLREIAWLLHQVKPNQTL